VQELQAAHSAVQSHQAQWLWSEWHKFSIAHSSLVLPHPSVWHERYVTTSLTGLCRRCRQYKLAAVSYHNHAASLYRPFYHFYKDVRSEIAICMQLYSEVVHFSRKSALREHHSSSRRHNDIVTMHASTRRAASAILPPTCVVLQRLTDYTAHIYDYGQ